MRGRASLLLLVVLLAGCGLFAKGDVAPPRDLPVVDEHGPFDPREAVDDDDAEATELLQGEKEIDEEAFADEPPARESVRGPPTDPAEEREATDAPAADDEPEGEVAVRGFEETEDGERVAPPEEVARLRVSRRAELRNIEKNAEDDDRAKADLARNPQREEPGAGESMTWTAVDLALEALIVAIGAAAVALLWTFGNRFPKTAVAVLLAAAAAAVYLGFQLG